MSKFSPTIHPWNQDVWQNLTMEPERANHALLFNGNSGLGKRDLALALAHFVLTDTHSQSESLFSAGSHPDLHVVMPEIEVKEDLMGSYAARYLEVHSGKPKRTITIEQIRRLSSALTTHPHISSHRVILIFFAETMNRNASNALLKSLEEPPANTLFIVVTDEVSKLVSTIRSRCSLVNFYPPETAAAKAWLAHQKVIPEAEIDTYLAMANNHPLAALALFKGDYLTSLKAVFSEVNSLWMRRAEVTAVAKSWQQLGGLAAVEILQKLTTDLLRTKLTEQPATVFFPVQMSWISSSSAKLDKQRLLDLVDQLNEAKRLLTTTVDELLVLETVAHKFYRLPA